MKIEILNYTPTGIAKFLETLEKNLPNGICPSPITLDLSFLNITIDCNNQMTITNYDYFSSNEKGVFIISKNSSYIGGTCLSILTE